MNDADEFGSFLMGVVTGGILSLIILSACLGREYNSLLEKAKQANAVYHHPQTGPSSSLR